MQRIVVIPLSRLRPRDRARSLVSEVLPDIPGVRGSARIQDELLVAIEDELITEPALLYKLQEDGLLEPDV